MGENPCQLRRHSIKCLVHVTFKLSKITCWSVGIIFFTFFYIFNIFVPSPAENKTKKKQKEVSGDLFRDLGP